MSLASGLFSPSISYPASDGPVYLSSSTIRAFTILSFCRTLGCRSGPSGLPCLLMGPACWSSSYFSLTTYGNVWLGSLGYSAWCCPPFSHQVGPPRDMKLDSSHSRLAGRAGQAFQRLLGFPPVPILRKKYASEVTTIVIAWVIPGGPYFPPRDYIFCG